MAWQSDPAKTMKLENEEGMKGKTDAQLMVER